MSPEVLLIPKLTPTSSGAAVTQPATQLLGPMSTKSLQFLIQTFLSGTHRLDVVGPAAFCCVTINTHSAGHLEPLKVFTFSLQLALQSIRACICVAEIALPWIFTRSSEVHLSNSSIKLLSSTTASNTRASARKKNTGANIFMVQRGVETSRIDAANSDDAGMYCRHIGSTNVNRECVEDGEFCLKGS